MKNIGFYDNNMIEILKSIIGKKFEYIEFTNKEKMVSFGNVALNVDGQLIEISNHEDDKGWDEDYDSAHFECKIISEYEPTVTKSIVSKLNIQEIIKDVNIIYDEITNEYYNFNYDMALEIITENHKYLISRGWFYSEDISINIDTEFDSIYPVSKVEDDWNADSDGDYITKVNRNIINISERSNIA